ncbi:MAG: tRNA uridine-5-carboxymethylaminomethyl(34) synthesis GTPase MnmE [Christensenellaceae bacterium]|jgi:tRNA modification GTPase|nr:tRNA uridine-5-carboxymethylaminomethyl(34) synthesis GTPase MnmE [Christensenellaceae bacterium]
MKEEKENNSREKTIAGIATGNGRAGIGIIRISGDDSLLIINKILLKGKETNEDGAASAGTEIKKARYAYLRKIFGTDCIIIYFKGPQSFTGEDVIEVQAIGGECLLRKIYKTIIDTGAYPADRGEFTKRAFFNNKLSLDEAENVMDIINAESEIEIELAARKNAEMKMVNEIERDLIECKSILDALFDYPDETDKENECKALAEVKIRMARTIKSIKTLLSTYNKGAIIKRGINVAIIGEPNVGKSSLFNSILKQDRSIVTNEAGTTTDLIKESIEHKGIRINFIDTAGIRKGKGKIEKAGIDRSKKSVKTADIVVFVNTTNTICGKSSRIVRLTKRQKYIVVCNKVDKNPVFPEISAKNNLNIDRLLDEILDAVIGEPQRNDISIVINDRHKRILEDAKKILEEQSGNIDIIENKITSALLLVGQITGTEVTERTLNEIFSRFCLGK